MERQPPRDSIDQSKYWVKDIQVGQTVYRGLLAFKVLSAGIDFLILKKETDGSTSRVLRNTAESLTYSFTPAAAS